MGPVAKKTGGEVGVWPTQFQLALALAVAKSKPGGISVRDYLHKIRTHILTGTRVENYGSSEEYLDAAAYWRDMFKEAQVEILELQTKITRLERVKEKSRVGGVSPALGVSAGVGGGSEVTKTTITPGFKDVTTTKKGTKRKQDEAKLAASTRPAKKVAGKNETPVNDNLTDDLGIFDVPGAGSTTLLHLYRAHKLYQQIEPDPQGLAYHLTQAASNLANHVSTVAQQVHKYILDAALQQDKRLRTQLINIATAKYDTEFPRLLRAAGRAFMSLFHGLEMMWEKETEAARRHHGGTTYVYIQAFGTLLDAMASNCMVIAQLNVIAATTSSASTTAATKESEPPKPTKQKTTLKPRIAQELTSLLLALLTHLTPSRQGAHTALFEGMLYLLLERTARRLYLLTFNRERGETIEKEMGEGNPSPVAQIGTIEAQGVGLEVKFLVGVLERSMSLTPGFLGSLSGVEGPAKAKGGGVRGKQAAKGKLHGKIGSSLSFSAKELLQRTLVECMFGSNDTHNNPENDETEDEEDDDPGAGNENRAGNRKAKGDGKKAGSGVPNNDFIELLRKPMFVGPLPQVPRVEEVDVPEWFRGEVWRLIGWDVLGWEGDI